jgi:hypothetical protein
MVEETRKNIARGGGHDLGGDDWRCLVAMALVSVSEHSKARLYGAHGEFATMSTTLVHFTKKKMPLDWNSFKYSQK